MELILPDEFINGHGHMQWSGSRKKRKREGGKGKRKIRFEEIRTKCD